MPVSAGLAARRSRRPRRRSSVGARSMPPKWPPRAVGEPAITIVGSVTLLRIPMRSRSSFAMMAAMRIADFALERFFARWEFAVEHLLCASDLQGYPMAELLGLADAETRALWDGL